MPLRGKTFQKGASGMRSEVPELHHLLEALCIARGIPTPALQVIDDPALNAYATGLNPQQYAVTVTTGLMAALDAREMQAVLAPYPSTSTPPS